MVDNGSKDNSINKIEDWALNKNFELPDTNFPFLVLPPSPKPIIIHDLLNDVHNENKSEVVLNLKRLVEKKEIIFLKYKQNLGFAIGNNLAIEIALKLFESKYVYLLNNDTVIEKNSITEIINKMEEFKDPCVITSAIYAYYNPNMVSNLGGKINIWGNRKYYTKIKNRGLYHYVSFVTGCALMIPKSVIENHGALSEKFFFGEEDFEYSLRLRKYKIKILCVFSSKVYHKISTASKKLMEDQLHHKLIYFLNRIINLRDYYPNWIWIIWRIAMVISSGIWLITKYSIGIKKSIRFVKYLYLYSNDYSDVKKENFDFIIKNSPLKW